MYELRDDESHFASHACYNHLDKNCTEVRSLAQGIKIARSLTSDFSWLIHNVLSSHAFAPINRYHQAFKMRITALLLMLFALLVIKIEARSQLPGKNSEQCRSRA